MSTKCAFVALANSRGINHLIIIAIIFIIIIIIIISTKGTHKNAKLRKPPSCFFCKNGGIGNAFYLRLAFISPPS